MYSNTLDNVYKGFTVTFTHLTLTYEVQWHWQTICDQTLPVVLQTSAIKQIRSEYIVAFKKCLQHSLPVKTLQIIFNVVLCCCCSRQYVYRCCRLLIIKIITIRWNFKKVFLCSKNFVQNCCQFFVVVVVVRNLLHSFHSNSLCASFPSFFLICFFFLVFYTTLH